MRNFSKTKIKRTDLLYPELSYKTVGVLFDVYNNLGPGHHERYYQRAVSQALKEVGLKFKSEMPIPVNFRGTTVGRYYLDFLIDDKLILEIKKDGYFSKRHIDQVLNYLKSSGLKLAILANFSHRGILFKRIVNFG